MRDILYLAIISLGILSATFPESVGKWQARRDVAAQMEWDKLYICKECKHD